MNFDVIKKKEDEFGCDVYPKRLKAIVRGKGVFVWDSEGRKYIDCSGGYGCSNVGHCNDDVIAAIKQQSERLICLTEIFYNDVRAELFEKLSEISELKTSFLCNSGTEATEGAMKFARAFTKKKEIIATMRGFHGRTMGALSATYKKEYKEDFEPLVPGFKHVPYGNIEEMCKAITENTAAIIVEPVQGEGGIIPAPPEYLKQIREICDEKDIIFIADEIQTGFARTGKMFACQHYKVKPDIMCVAKSFAGGYPMGAFMMRNGISIDKTKHGSTFGGNPLGCAAALATIKYIQDHNLEKRSEEMGNYFLGELKKLQSPKIREVRGLGLMLGIELKEKVAQYITPLMNEGVIFLVAGHTVLRMLPPLVIEKEQVDHTVAALKKVL